MVDLVGTCPKDEWDDWLFEGDNAGDSGAGQEYEWCSGHSLARMIEPGDRFYIVAHGKLRGYALVTRVQGGCIIRRGNAVACTLGEGIKGFRGLRRRWWARSEECPFPDWKTVGT